MSTKSWCLSIAIGALVTASDTVFASPAQFNYVGTVTYTDGTLSGVSIGNVVSGTFSYDPSTAPNLTLGSTLAEYQLPGGQINASVGGHAASASTLSAQIQNDFNGNVEDTVALSGGSPAIIDGVQGTNASLYISLASKYGNTGVLSSTALPTSFDVAAFDAWAYGTLQRDGTASGTILEFNVTSITAVPEPGTGSMLMLGLGGLGCAVRRRQSDK